MLNALSHLVGAAVTNPPSALSLFRAVYDVALARAPALDEEPAAPTSLLQSLVGACGLRATCHSVSWGVLGSRV